MRVVDDAVEEVDGEERAEEHDLRPDEEEDADDCRRDSRAVVDRRRMEIRIAVAVRRPVPGRFRGSTHDSATT